MNTLDRICADKRVHIQKQKELKSLSLLQEEIKNVDKPKGFIKRLKDIAKNDPPALITEVKKASPSKGIIREDFNPVQIACTYENHGAACLSVLTDEPYFHGKDSYLQAIRKSVSIPILRKDFMLDEYQIYESRALGADCVLLIMAALDDLQAKNLYVLSESLEMDVLVEIHDHEELDRALKLNPRMVGVNNRNLKSLDVSLQTGIDLARLLPDSVFKVGESGIYSPQDITLLKEAGYQAFLVGESLMREPDIGDAVKKIRNRN